jgi:hypothetical protein
MQGSVETGSACGEGSALESSDRSPFLDILGELRNMIYKFVLKDIEMTAGPDPIPISHTFHRISRNSAFRQSLVLSHVSRAIREEFRPLYLKTKTIHVLMSEVGQFFIVSFKTNDCLSSTLPYKSRGAVAAHPEPRRYSTSLLLLIDLAHELKSVKISLAMQAASRDLKLISFINDKLLENKRPAWKRTLRKDIHRLELSSCLGYITMTFNGDCNMGWTNQLSVPWEVTSGSMPGREEYMKHVGLATENAKKINLLLYRNWSEYEERQE